MKNVKFKKIDTRTRNYLFSEIKVGEFFTMADNDEDYKIGNKLKPASKKRIYLKIDQGQVFTWEDEFGKPDIVVPVKSLNEIEVRLVKVEIKYQLQNDRNIV